MMQLIKCENHDSVKLELDVLEDVLEVGNSAHARHWIRLQRFSDICSILRKSASLILGSDEYGRPYA